MTRRVNISGNISKNKELVLTGTIFPSSSVRRIDKDKFVAYIKLMRSKHS
jgi:hypothetical protein